MWENESVADEAEEQTEPASTFSKIKALMKTGSRQQEEESAPDEQDNLPKSKEELKHFFLDKLFPLQLKWASSTVTDVSFMDKSYYEDETLKFFLQRFPDTYLLMYFPIFNIKKAPVDGDIILLSPIGIEIIYLMEQDEGITFVAGDERKWWVEGSKEQSKMLSPMIALKRTEKIIKGILNTENIDFPITKVILSRTNKIRFDSEPYNTRIIGKNEFDNWFKDKRNLVSPLKSQQLKIMELLLKNCQTTAFKRPEWEEDTATFTMGTEGQ